MRIIDRLMINGEILAYCVGDDIPADFRCNKISVNGQDYSVLKSGSVMSFCGKMSALMTLDVMKLEDVPLGDVTIVQ